MRILNLRNRALKIARPVVQTAKGAKAHFDTESANNYSGEFNFALRMTVQVLSRNFWVTW